MAAPQAFVRREATFVDEVSGTSRHWFVPAGFPFRPRHSHSSLPMPDSSPCGLWALTAPGLRVTLRSRESTEHRAFTRTVRMRRDHADINPAPAPPDCHPVNRWSRRILASGRDHALGESGGNVVGNASGSLDLTGLRFVETAAYPLLLDPAVGAITLGPSWGSVENYDGLPGWSANFGSGGKTTPGSGSGFFFAVAGNTFAIQRFYAKFSPVSSSATWQNTTLDNSASRRALIRGAGPRIRSP